MPNEIVCDSSRALLLGVLWNYTNCKSIEEYSDRCFTGPLPKCFIRVDVAHVVKIYANFLKQQHRSIKNIYLGAIAKLIVARNFQEAKDILTLILITCRSVYQGNNSLGEKTRCSLAKEKLKSLLICKEDVYETGNEEVDQILEVVKDVDSFEDNPDDDERQPEEETTSKICLQWAQKIDKEVKESCSEWGEDVNAHHNNDLADKIVHHCQNICMWTCVVRDKFGFGRVPASSAPVESEFNDLKNRVFKGKLPLRLDDFVMEHVQYIGNRNKIIIARDYTREEEKENEIEPEEVEVQIEDSDNAVVQKSSCELCKGGESIEGAHRCKDCLKVVHILPQCSVSLSDEEEGYGQKRLCLQCHSRRDADQLRSVYNEREDWGGLVTALETKVTRKGRYINGNFNKEDFELHPKLKKISVLLNGNILKLNAITVEKLSCTVVNTCAFDSIFQAILLAEMDKPFLQNLNLNNLFFNTVLHVAEKGVTSFAYSNRAKLLYTNKWSNLNPLTKDSVEVVCTSNVGELASTLLNDIPSVKIMISCKNGCKYKEELSTHISIPYEYILRQDFNDKIQEILLHSTEQMTCKICEEDCSKTVELLGSILFFDVCVNCEAVSVAIENLEMQIKVPAITMDSYELFAIIDFLNPRNLRNFNEDAIGHYRTVGRRPNGIWTIMDDLQKTSKQINKKTKITPLYLMYRSCK